jgi:ribosomal protein S18 acetylase RimI-like enzyme
LIVTHGFQGTPSSGESSNVAQAAVPVYEVRPCGLGDLISARTLLRASFHHAHDRIIGEEHANRVDRRVFSYVNLAAATVYAMLPGPAKMFVATRDGCVRGLAMAVRDREEPEAVLYMLYVDPEWKGQGVGSALLQAVIAHFSDVRAIRLEVLKGNTAATSWYQAKGFEVYGATENATNCRGVAALYMQKEL